MTRSCAALLALSMVSGCYLSHGRGGEPPSRDADVPLPRRDAGTDAGTDAGAPACCSRWAFDRRVAIEDFMEETVTPRLVELGGRPGLVVTGPSDPVGPSGAHYLRLSRDLAAHDPPVAVTRGSFTWGQPASAGDRFAVCWGTAPANVVRVYDASGRAITAQATLDSPTSSPCVASAYSEGRFAFAYTTTDAAGAATLRARVVDAESGAIGASFDVPLPDRDTSASLAGVPGGFAFAVSGARSQLWVFDFEGRPLAEATLEPARRVRLVASGGSLDLLRVFERPAPGMRVEDVWTRESFEVPALAPIDPPRQVAAFDPPPSPGFAATAGTCGESVLGIAHPALGVVRGATLIPYLPDAPAPSSLRGDTSVLVIGDDAYVAFAAVEPIRSRSQVHVDRWTCAAHDR